MRLARLALFLLLAASAAAARAELVTFQFGGTITSSTIEGIAYGDRFEGFYSFETTVPDTWENTPAMPIGDGSGPLLGHYQQTTAAGFRVGSHSVLTRFPGPDDSMIGGIYVWNGIGGWDSYGVNTLDFSLSFQDPTNTAIHSDELLLTPPDLSHYPHTQFSTYMLGGLIGVIDTVVIGPPNVGQVPLPGSLALVLAGLALMAGVRVAART
jgi:hypothetical protein